MTEYEKVEEYIGDLIPIKIKDSLNLICFYKGDLYYYDNKFFFNKFSHASIIPLLCGYLKIKMRMENIDRRETIRHIMEHQWS